MPYDYSMISSASEDGAQVFTSMNSKGEKMSFESAVLLLILLNHPPEGKRSRRLAKVR